MTKLTFSGHETFQCRSLWLKKGFDFLSDGRSFHAPEAVSHLGVGKNMVGAIRYWLNAFGVVKQDKLTKFGRFIFGSRGRDPYLEDLGTLWLLHYSLVTNNVASLYSLLFNEFRKERVDFTREQLKNFIRRKCEEEHTPFSLKTADRDIGVLLKNYVRPGGKSSNLEEDYTGIFLELDLIREVPHFEGETAKRYRIENGDRDDIPPEILLFCILANSNYGRSVSFHELLNGDHSVGNVFALTAEGLLRQIDRIISKYAFVAYNEDAGIREIQFKKIPDKFEILANYYAN